MPAPISDEDYKRRARRRLVGAVALAIVAVIILPLVLQDEPPPAGPLEVHMPSPSTANSKVENAVEYAPPPVNTTVEPPEGDEETGKQIADASSQAKSENKPPKIEMSVTTTKAIEPVSRESEANGIGSFTVQVGVFADKSNVERLQSRISALGMKSYTDQVGEATRIRVGTFSAREEADKVAARMAAAGIPGKVVEK